MDIGKLFAGSRYDMARRAAVMNDMEMEAARAAAAGRTAMFANMGGAPSGPQGVPIPGATPMPQGGVPPQMQGPGGVRPQMMGPDAGGPPMAAPPPQMQGPGFEDFPAAAPPPQMQGAPLGAPSTQPQGGARFGAQPAMSGVAQPTGDPFTDSQQTLQAIAADIQQRNPGIAPDVLAAAVLQTVDTMKGLAPEQRALIAAQAKYYDTMARHEVGMDRNDATREVAGVRADAMRDVEGMRSGSRERVAKIAAAARTYAADQTLDVARINADARVIAAETGADVREVGYELAYQAGQAQADAKIRAATAGIGGKDPGPTERPTIATPTRTRPARTARPAATPSGRATAPAAGGDSLPLPPKGRYKSAKDVANATGLSKDQKLRILRRDFGMP